MSQHEAWIATNAAPSDDACRTLEEAHGPALAAPANSSAEPCLSTFVEISQICPNLSNLDDVKRDPATAVTPQTAPAPAKKQGGYNVAYPDRGAVISRYKEKRKNRRRVKERETVSRGVK